MIPIKQYYIIRETRENSDDPWGNNKIMAVESNQSEAHNKWKELSFKDVDDCNIKYYIKESMVLNGVL